MSAHLDQAPSAEDFDARREIRTLLAEAAGGSDEAIGTIFDRYMPHVLRRIRRRLPKPLRTKFDSADFVQTVWLTFCYEPERIRQCKDEEEVIGYLCAIADNAVGQAERQYLGAQKRQLRRERSLEGMKLDETLASRERPAADVAADRDEIDALLRSEPDLVRRAGRLCGEGHTTAEIARLLGVGARRVRRFLERLKRKRPR